MKCLHWVQSLDSSQQWNPLELFFLDNCIKKNHKTNKQTNPTSPPTKIKLLSIQTYQFILQSWNPAKRSDTRICGLEIMYQHHWLLLLFFTPFFQHGSVKTCLDLFEICGEEERNKTNKISQVLENTLKPEKYCKKNSISYILFTYMCI